MNHNERQLMRLLHGELTPREAARVEADIKRDAAMQATYERLASTWRDLELPEPKPVPTAFVNGIKALAHQQHDHELSWAQAPMWARTGAAVALTAGLTLGLVLGGSLGEALAPESLVPAPEDLASLEDATLQADFELDPLSLAEIYWLSIDDHERLFSDTATDETAADSPGGSVQ